MFSCSRAAFVGALLAVLPAAYAQPNDSCSSPDPISGLGVFAFDLAASTTDGVGNPLCLAFGQDGIADDLWFCWSNTTGGPVVLQTCGQTSVDTKVAIYDGCTPCPEASGIVACNDDSCSLQSRAGWTAVANHSYMIRIGHYPGSVRGAGTFTIESGVLAGPIVNPANGHSYYLLQPAGWTASEAGAIALGGHLATINDAAENEWVRVELANFGGVDRRVWIGLNDLASEGTFVWTSGQPVGFTNWSGGEPNDSGGIEDAVELFGSNGQWNDNRDVPTGLTVYGAVEVEAAPRVPGDCNCDGLVNNFDIDAFVLAVSDATLYMESYPNCNILNADIDNDGQVNNFDIDPFVALLSGG